MHDGIDSSSLFIRHLVKIPVCRHLQAQRHLGLQQTTVLLNQNVHLLGQFHLLLLQNRQVFLSRQEVQENKSTAIYTYAFVVVALLLLEKLKVKSLFSNFKCGILYLRHIRFSPIVELKV